MLHLQNRIPPILATLGLLTLFLPRARAAIPQAAKDDPRYKLGYLVVTYYSGVKGDGSGDSLPGLQTAVNDAYANGLVALFPSGTYTISDTLRCQDFFTAAGTNADGSLRFDYTTNPTTMRACIIQGSSIGPRPVIKLAATAPKFDDPTRIRPMLLLRLYQSTQFPNAAKAEPPDANLIAAPPGYKVDTAGLFNWELRNLDFDCAAHPGAVAVVFPAAQGSLIANVKVNATGAFAGFYGLPGRNWGAVNIEVIGGQYGIRTGTAVAGEVAAGSSVFGARFSGQTVAAIEYDDFVPLVMAGFEISMANGPAFTVKTNNATANNTMTLLDGRIEFTANATGAAAINNPNGKNLYLRNLYISGAETLVRSSPLVARMGSGSWSRIDEYSYTDQRTTTGTSSLTTRSLIDGVINSMGERVARVTANSEPPPDDLLRRHTPAHGMPTFEGTGSPATVVVTDPPYNAVPGDSISDTAAIQQAIDAASAAGHGRVFIPKFDAHGTSSGAFLLDRTLTLRSNTVFFGAAKGFVSELATDPNWKPTAPTDILRTVDDAEASTYLGNVALTASVSLYRHPFTFYHWQAGRASETFDLRMDAAYEFNPPARPNHYTAVSFSGSAGGRHFFFPQGGVDRVGNTTTVYPSNNGDQYRSLRITGTTQPLWLYGFNLEGGKHDRRRYDAEITNAANIRWLGWKREGLSSMLLLKDTRNFALYGAGAMRERPAAGTGQFEITGTSTNLLLANLLVQTATSPTAAFTLIETIDGQPRNAIAYPEGVSLYQRGAIDDRSVALDSGSPVTGQLALVNLSTRTTVTAAEGPLMVGFVVGGTGTRELLVRAVGPSLAGFGVEGALSDPLLRLYRDQRLIAENDDWSITANTSQTIEATSKAGAFALATGSRDGALVARLEPGAYTAHALAKTASTGVVLVEVFDLGGSTGARLTNCSTLSRTTADGGILITGFVLSGSGQQSVLVRAVGPALTQFGLVDVVRDPRLELFSGAALLASIDNWNDAPNATQMSGFSTQNGAFSLPVGSKDAALLTTLRPGAYTVQIRGDEGFALAELYAP